MPRDFRKKQGLLGRVAEGKGARRVVDVCLANRKRKEFYKGP